jgi:hypothetical protein
MALTSVFTGIIAASLSFAMVFANPIPRDVNLDAVSLFKIAFFSLVTWLCP